MTEYLKRIIVSIFESIYLIITNITTGTDKIPNIISKISKTNLLYLIKNRTQNGMNNSLNIIFNFSLSGIYTKIKLFIHNVEFGSIKGSSNVQYLFSLYDINFNKLYLNFILVPYGNTGSPIVSVCSKSILDCYAWHYGNDIFTDNKNGNFTPNKVQHSHYNNDINHPNTTSVLMSDSINANPTMYIYANSSNVVHHIVNFLIPENGMKFNRPIDLRYQVKTLTGTFTSGSQAWETYQVILG